MPKSYVLLQSVMCVCFFFFLADGPIWCPAGRASDIIQYRIEQKNAYLSFATTNYYQKGMQGIQAELS